MALPALHRWMASVPTSPGYRFYAGRSMHGNTPRHADGAEAWWFPNREAGGKALADAIGGTWAVDGSHASPPIGAVVDDFGDLVPVDAPSDSIRFNQERCYA
jgi:hypothetical protein